MPYNVSIQEKQDYIRIEVTGERDRGHEAKDAIDLWTDIAAVCKTKGIFRVLAIYNLSGDLPTMAAYNVGTKLVENDTIRKMKVALVDLNERSRRTNLFTETVVANRSSSNQGKVFDNENEAIEWLSGSK